MNTFQLTRRLAGHRVTIRAEYIERLALYGLDIRIDGGPWDWRQSDDVLSDAAEIFAEAFEEVAAFGISGDATVNC